MLKTYLALTALLCVIVQAANIATISLGDRTSYSASAIYTATLQGTAIDIIDLGAPAETGVPALGWDVHISPDLKKSLDSIAADTCQKGDHDQCYQKLSSVLIGPNTDLQVRQLGQLALLAAAGLGLLLSSIYMVLFDPHNGLQRDIHIPAAQISQVSSILASSTYPVVAIATGNNVPFATITPKPSPAVPTISITPAAVTTMTADAQGHKQGDIVFTITEDQASRWQELLARTNTTDCDLASINPRKVGKRDDRDSLLDNVLCGAGILLANMIAPGIAGGLREALPLPFAWLDPDTELAMITVRDYTRDHAAEFGVDGTTADRFSMAAFIVSREVLYNGGTLVGDGHTAAPVVVEAAQIAPAHVSVSSCIPATPSIGLVGCEMAGNIKGCTTRWTTTTTCLEDVGYTFTTDRDIILTTFVNPWTVTNGRPYQQALATAAPQSTDNVQKVNQGDLRCGQRTDPGNAVYFVDRAMMLDAASFFCDKLSAWKVTFSPGKVSTDQTRHELNYNNHLGDPVYLTLDWIDNAGCPSTGFSWHVNQDLCMNRISTIIDGCDTSNEKGLYWWKQGGSFFRDCMSWSIRRDDWVYSGLGVSAKTDSSDSWRPAQIQCSGDNDCHGDWGTKHCSGPTSAQCKWDADFTSKGWCICA